MELYQIGRLHDKGPRVAKLFRGIARSRLALTNKRCTSPGQSFHWIVPSFGLFI